MTTNGLLSRGIFDRNKEQRPFFVEESYVIPWMYEFLEPHGLIMKLNSQPVQITADMVRKDCEFWDAKTKRLMAWPAFVQNKEARMAFSKLRGNIGGIYAARRMYPRAFPLPQQAPSDSHTPAMAR